MFRDVIDGILLTCTQLSSGEGSTFPEFTTRGRYRLSSEEYDQR